MAQFLDLQQKRLRGEKVYSVDYRIYKPSKRHALRVVATGFSGSLVDIGDALMSRRLKGISATKLG
jgi:hypothetical protein